MLGDALGVEDRHRGQLAGERARGVVVAGRCRPPPPSSMDSLLHPSAPAASSTPHPSAVAIGVGQDAAVRR